MQYTITDSAALEFARTFYSALGDNLPVDAAVAEARNAINLQNNASLEWGTPVLTMRSQDGQLFDLAKVTDSGLPLRPPVAKLNAQIQRTEIVPQQQSALAVEGIMPEQVAANEIPMQTARIDKPTAPAQKDKQEPHLPKTTGAVTHDEEQGDREVKAYQLVQPSAKERKWWPIGLGLFGFTVVLILSVIGVPAYQANQRNIQATATQQALATAIQQVRVATATEIAIQLQATATALAPLAQATVTAMAAQSATALTPLRERFGMEFVPVPGGTFMLGNPPGIGWFDEQPQHAVTVENFWIGKTEVTNRQYRYFVDASGYTQRQWWTDAGWHWREENKITEPRFWQDERWNQPAYPVVGVSWYEAVAYTRWLYDTTGLPIRLPTEAEWERSARGDDARIYPWGNEWDGSRLNYCGKNCDQSWKDEAVDDGYAYTAPVGHYPAGAGPYGAFDLAGNVLEWTNSRYVYSYDQYDEPYVLGSLGSSDDRAVRGGSWSSPALGGRPAGTGSFRSIGSKLSVFGWWSLPAFETLIR